MIFLHNEVKLILLYYIFFGFEDSIPLRRLEDLELGDYATLSELTFFSRGGELMTRSSSIIVSLFMFLSSITS